jgi:hypothetical protein
MNTSTRAGSRSGVLLATLAVAAVGLTTGCSSPSGGGGATTSPDEPSAPPTSEEPTNAAACLQPVGDCLGVLEAGDYSSSAFQPGFSYTVPEGWQQIEDIETSFMLLAPGEAVEDVFAGTASFVWMLAPAQAAARECEPALDSAVETTVDAVLEHLGGRSDVELTEPEPVEIGGFSGMRFDATQVAEEGLRCPGFEDQPWTPILGAPVGPDVGAVGPLEGTLTRYHLLEHGDGLVAIGIDHDGDEGDPVVDEATQIIESLEFTP